MDVYDSIPTHIHRHQVLCRANKDKSIFVAATGCCTKFAIKAPTKSALMNSFPSIVQLRLLILALDSCYLHHNWYFVVGTH